MTADMVNALIAAETSFLEWAALAILLVVLIAGFLALRVRLRALRLADRVIKSQPEPGNRPQTRKRRPR